MKASPAPAHFLRDEAGGADIPLAGRIVTFGSASDCALRIPGKGIPERLGHLLYREGTYEVQCMLPGDAVKVNGKPVTKPVPLAHGDRIGIAHRSFLFSGAAGAAPAVSASATARGAPATSGAASVPEVATGERASVGGIVEALVRMMRDRDPDVFASLVASVSGLLRCDAARVVEEDAATGERRTIARYPDHTGLERFSNQAIDWARGSGSAVLAQEGEWDRGSSGDSLRRNAVGSVICAALRLDGAVAGYLYLDRTRESHPFDRRDQALCDSLRPLFELILSRRREVERQRETIARLQSAGLEDQGGIIFSGKAMERAMDLARRAARTDAVVLIQGETGTGKEMLARFIHARSARAQGPFIALNCGAIPENLVESELFGHEKGAFTGADRLRTGLFEAAGGGTLFLDEIGELPPAVQVKLLRVLQEGEIRRVGGQAAIPVDARILAATHRDLAKDVAEGRFRQDLFFRLSVLGVALPPLRERGEDIVLLAEYLLKKYLLQFGLAKRAFSAAARDRLMRHPFPGNVRELENIVQKALILSDGEELHLEELADGETHGPASAPPAGPHADPPSGSGIREARTLRAIRSEAERGAIAEALERSGGNVSAAAKSLDVDRKWLMKLMDEYGLDADAYRKAG